NAVIIGGNKTKITLLPTTSKRKRNVVVKIFYKNENLDNKRITSEKYQKITQLYLQLSEKDTTKTLWLDPPSLKIQFKKDNFRKDFFYIGIPD
ncbi:hypothetical protein Q0P47_13735, partial [Staphylococcus aureus]|nr:hypothetical protein [Staphylococcus aureus]